MTAVSGAVTVRACPKHALTAETKSPSSSSLQKAIARSAEVRRGVPESAEQRSAISDGLKRAYAEGRRTVGHSEETKRKISESKTGRDPLNGCWSFEHSTCVVCAKTDSPHKGRGLCTSCWQKERRTKVNSGLIVKARWAKDFDRCIECDKSDSEHKRQGQCSRCYQAGRKQANG